MYGYIWLVVSETSKVLYKYQSIMSMPDHMIVMVENCSRVLQHSLRFQKDNRRCQSIVFLGVYTHSNKIAEAQTGKTSKNYQASVLILESLTARTGR